jgi:hypothetical protein
VPREPEHVPRSQRFSRYCDSIDWVTVRLCCVVRPATGRITAQGMTAPAQMSPDFKGCLGGTILSVLEVTSGKVIWYCLRVVEPRLACRNIYKVSHPAAVVFAWSGLLAGVAYLCLEDPKQWSARC